MICAAALGLSKCCLPTLIAAKQNHLDVRHCFGSHVHFVFTTEICCALVVHCGREGVCVIKVILKYQPLFLLPVQV